MTRQRTAVTEIVEALEKGTMTTEQAVTAAQGVTWATTDDDDQPVGRTGQDLAGAAETQDPPTMVTGSFDEVAVAHARGAITTTQYDALARVWCAANGITP
jgi:hypothetical protein